MYVLIGVNGFFGAYFVKAIKALTDSKILAVSRSLKDGIIRERVETFCCDITRAEDVKRLKARISKEDSCKIIYLAAYHNPDLVEKNPDIAWNVNITALAFLLNEIGPVSRFVYISTDSVYGDGGRTYHFAEGDPLKPVNLYGKQKALAENIVTSFGGHAVRYPFLIGPSLLAHKKHFYDVITETICKGKPVSMFCDSWRSSLDFNTASQLLVQLMERVDHDFPPVLNLSGDQDLSKYDIGCMIAQSLGISDTLIIPVTVKGNHKIFAVPRADSTLLDNTFVKQLLGLSRIQIDFPACCDREEELVFCQH